MIRLFNRKTVRLAAGIVGLAGFVLIVAPAIAEWDLLKPHMRIIEDKQIEAGALFYTESEQALRANYELLRED